MRRLGLIAAILFELCAPSSAQFNGCPAGFCAGTPGGAAASPTITPGANVVPILQNFAPGNVTFTGLNGGTNYPSGAVVFVGVTVDQPSTPITGPQIGGQTATLVTGASASPDNRCQLFTATMPSSEPDTFLLTNGSGYQTIGAVGVYFQNITPTPVAASLLAYGTTAAPLQPTTAIAIPINGFGWVFLGSTNSLAVTGNTPAWGILTPSFITSAVGDTNAVLNTKGEIASAHTTKTLTGGTSWQPNVTGSPFNFGSAGCLGAIAVGP